MLENFIGLVLDERYEIQAPLGSGGMALVFEAHQRSLHRQVAVKIIKPEFAWSADVIDAFIQEARISASLEHLHVLTVYDSGTQIISDQQLPYLVMQLAGGGTLRERIEGQPLDLDEAKRILEQVCSALDYAHGQKVVHLDLKPGNILFDEQGNALVADFGLAQLFHTTLHVKIQDVSGTPLYMPFEQWQGKPAGPLSDVYALGITLYETLTGELPKRELMEGGLFVHLEHSLPRPIEDVIKQATQSDPNSRYHTAGELAQAFTAAVAELASPPLHFWPDTEGPEGKSMHPPKEKDQEPAPSWSNIKVPESKPARPLPQEHKVLPANKRSLLRRAWIPRTVTGLVVLIVVVGLALLGQRWLKNLIREMLMEVSPTQTPPSTVTTTSTATLAPAPTLTRSPSIVPTPTPLPIPYVIVPTEQLRIYTGPDENCDVLEDVYRGDRLPLRGRLADGTWWQVDYLGKEGWIRAQPMGASIDPTLLPVVQAPECVRRTPTPTKRPTPNPTRKQMLNLSNPTFENIREDEIPGWSWWAEDNYVPDGEYDPDTSYNTPFFRQTYDPARMIDGATLQIEATAFVKFKLYIYQTVGAPPDVTVRFQVLTKAYSAFDDGRIKLAAGIDPNGSSGCSQARWGEEMLIDQSAGTEQLTTPDVTVGDAGQVTVCLYAETLYPAHSNAAYFDNAELVANPK